MNKWILHIACLIALNVCAQKNQAVENTWKKLSKENGFRQSDDYQGPDEGYMEPASMKDADEQYESNSYNGLPYSSQQIQQSRQQSQSSSGNAPGGNGPGNAQAPPKVIPPTPPDLPDIDTPDIDTPDIDAPDIDISFSENFWWYFLVILLILLVGFVLFVILRNRQPAPANTKFTELSEDVNPMSIPKSELELRLEAAIAEGNYRECVRIYFLFGLRELIGRNLIFWRKDKTNIHYQIEMSGKSGESDFTEIAGIYELVWYGDYHIDNRSWNFLERDLKRVYTNLSGLHE